MSSSVSRDSSNITLYITVFYEPDLKFNFSASLSQIDDYDDYDYGSIEDDFEDDYDDINRLNLSDKIKLLTLLSSASLSQVDDYEDGDYDDISDDYDDYDMQSIDDYDE